VRALSSHGASPCTSRPQRPDTPRGDHRAYWRTRSRNSEVNRRRRDSDYFRIEERTNNFAVFGCGKHSVTAWRRGQRSLGTAVLLVDVYATCAGVRRTRTTDNENAIITTITITIITPVAHAPSQKRFRRVTCTCHAAGNESISSPITRRLNRSPPLFSFVCFPGDRIRQQGPSPTRARTIVRTTERLCTRG